MRTCLRIVIFCFALMQGHQYVPAEELVPEMEREGILRFIAIENQKNFGEIKSWSGRYSYAESSPTAIPVLEPAPETIKSNRKQTSDQKLPPPPEVRIEQVLLHRKGNISFSVDMISQQLFVDFKEDISAAKAFKLTTGENIAVGELYKGYSTESLLTPDSITTLQPQTTYGPVKEAVNNSHTTTTGNSRLAKKSAIKPNLWRNDSDTLVDPRRFFSLSNKYIWEQLNPYADAIVGKLGDELKQTASDSLSIEKRDTASGTVYILTVVYGRSKPLEAGEVKSKRVTIFPEEFGFLPVESTKYSVDGSINNYRAWKYVEVQGIRIPDEYQYVTYKKGEVKFERHLTMLESTLNQQVANETFLPSESLTLDPGDRLYDKVTKEVLVFDGEKFVAPDQYSPMANPATEEGMSWWIITNLLVVLLIAALVLWKRIPNK